MCAAISRLVLVGLIGALIWAGPAAAEDKAKIAVLQLNARGIEADVASSITDLVIRQVDRSGLFETISMDDIRSLLQAGSRTAGGAQGRADRRGRPQVGSCT